MFKNWLKPTRKLGWSFAWIVLAVFMQCLWAIKQYTHTVTPGMLKVCNIMYPKTSSPYDCDAFFTQRQGSNAHILLARSLCLKQLCCRYLAQILKAEAAVGLHVVCWQHALWLGLLKNQSILFTSTISSPAQCCWYTYLRCLKGSCEHWTCDPVKITRPRTLGNLPDSGSRQ